MFGISGKLVDGKQNKFISHTVIVSFEERIDIEEDTKNEQSIWTYSQKTVPVNSEGTFLLELPDKGQLRGALVLDVVAPDGERLVSKELPIEKLMPRITIEVDVKTFPQILKNPDPFLGKRVKM